MSASTVRRAETRRVADIYCTPRRRRGRSSDVRGTHSWHGLVCWPSDTQGQGPRRAQEACDAYVTMHACMAYSIRDGSQVPPRRRPEGSMPEGPRGMADRARWPRSNFVCLNFGSVHPNLTIIAHLRSFEIRGISDWLNEQYIFIFN